ncbi:enoyl-CoA hydratase/carnithine racemase [Rhodoligotrophos appendicifer]|uniref:enoyl-CoA hydratase/isomerase family protein n=1 Tax=Rhodoligotrophos appendicifer TaxID=987056 RepID=UPI00118537F4|nr:enoyl-CoA hydratase/isomerase family protein [Rhodoligotrophos appendicifer]
MTTDGYGQALQLDWVDGDVAWARLIRPNELNTISLEVIEALGRALDDAQAKNARAFVITGEGRAFCAGAQLKYFTDKASPIGSTPVDYRDRYVGPICRLFDRLEAMAFPTIAAINGYALGGGFELALACDFRIMASTARLGLPEVKVGIIPAGGGVQKLMRFVGRARALDIVLTGRSIEAEEAERLGLVTAVAAPEQLEGAVAALIEQLKGGGPRAIAQAKLAVYRSEAVDPRSARDFGLEAMTVLMSTTDFAEGVSAFVEKRKPNW